MNYKYCPEGVCSRSVEFEIDGEGVLRNVRFIGGCSGNTQGVSALANGRNAREVMGCLRGIDCKGRGTSCPDQLSRAIAAALNEQ